MAKGPRAVRLHSSKPEKGPQYCREGEVTWSQEHLCTDQKTSGSGSGAGSGAGPGKGVLAGLRRFPLSMFPST
jgi:hypothetical protein